MAKMKWTVATTMAATTKKMMNIATVLSCSSQD
jgi:hypothetical protein